MSKTPITIFSGYLGSGKTTIIINSLSQYRQPRNFAMIKNEYGNASVDGALARMNNLAVKEVINGCLCCILVGSLNDAINELIDTQAPERILIEASGDALPFPIILELKKNKRVFVDGVISVVDCVNFEKVKDTSVVAREQAKYTDLIIFNKTEQVDEDKLYRVREEIYGINPDTAKIETNDGVVDPVILFGLSHTEIPDSAMLDHQHDLETFLVSLDHPVNQKKAQEVLAACSQGSFYRIKGFVGCDDGKTYLVNGVFGRFSWEVFADTEVPERLIFIGKDIVKHQKAITEYLAQAV